MSGRALALLLTLGPLLGCSTREADCDRVIGALQAAPFPTPNPSAGAAEKRDFVGETERTAQRRGDGLDALPILQAAEVQALREACRSHLTAIAQAASELGLALGAAEQASSDARASAEAMDSDLKALEERCKDSVCYALMERVARAPEGDAASDARRLADDVGAMSLEDPEAERARVTYAADLERHAVALAALTSAQAATGKAKDALTDAMRRHNEDVEQLNRVCER